MKAIKRIGQFLGSIRNTDDWKQTLEKNASLSSTNILLTWLGKDSFPFSTSLDRTSFTYVPENYQDTQKYCNELQQHFFQKLKVLDRFIILQRFLIEEYLQFTRQELPIARDLLVCKFISL